MTAPKSVRIVELIDRATFDAEIRYSGQPVILKGIAAHWPSVQAAQTSPKAHGKRIEKGRLVCPPVVDQHVERSGSLDVMLPQGR